MKLKDKIQALLDSDATSYAIAKETGSVIKQSWSCVMAKENSAIFQ